MTDGLVGKLVGRYVIEQKVGEGRYGVVYKATHESLDETVAIKIMSPEMSNPNASKLFMKEQNLTRKLDHPNIVKTLDIGTIENTGTNQEGTPYFVMEFMQNGSLLDLIKKGELLDEIKALELGMQCLEGFMYTHNAKNGTIIHTDIHPGNILFDYDWVAHISDFGLAKAHNLNVSGFSRSIIMGTFEPPDSLDALPDNRTDIFQLGCTLQQAVLGKASKTVIRNNVDGITLKKGETKKDLLDRINACQNVLNLVEKAMETYRTHRWQSAEEMYDAFSKTHDSIIYNNNAEKYLAPFNKINSKEGILSPEKIYKLQEIVEGVKNEPYRSEKVLDEIIHLYDEREIKDSKAILEQCNSFEKEESSHLTKKINEIHKKYDNFTNIARAYARQPPIDAA